MNFGTERKGGNEAMKAGTAHLVIRFSLLRECQFQDLASVAVADARGSVLFEDAESAEG